jgi:hypothetical protein
MHDMRIGIQPSGDIRSSQKHFIAYSPGSRLRIETDGGHYRTTSFSDSSLNDPDVTVSIGKEITDKLISLLRIRMVC